MKLYEKFFSIDPKYAYQIVDFIKEYCPVMMYKLPYIVAEKYVPNGKDPNLEQNKIIKNLSLKDINKIKLPGCNNCNLCDKEIFKEKRALLKSIKQKLLSANTLNQKKTNLIDYLNKELKDLGPQISRDFHGKLTLRKADNLYHLILIDFIEDIISNVNNNVSQNKENILYFDQILNL